MPMISVEKINQTFQWTKFTQGVYQIDCQLVAVSLYMKAICTMSHSNFCNFLWKIFLQTFFNHVWSAFDWTIKFLRPQRHSLAMGALHLLIMPLQKLILQFHLHDFKSLQMNPEKCYPSHIPCPSKYMPCPFKCPFKKIPFPSKPYQ